MKTSIMNKYIKTMEKITYDFQPAVLQNRGDGALVLLDGALNRYRWKKKRSTNATEVLVWETITADKITRAVVDYLWGNAWSKNF